MTTILDLIPGRVGVAEATWAEWPPKRGIGGFVAAAGLARTTLSLGASANLPTIALR